MRMERNWKNDLITKAMYIASWDSNMVYSPLQIWNLEFRSSFPYLQEWLPGLESHKDTTTKRFGLGLHRPMLPVKDVCILTWVCVQKKTTRHRKLGPSLIVNRVICRHPFLRDSSSSWSSVKIWLPKKGHGFMCIYIHNIRRLAYVNIYIMFDYY